MTASLIIPHATRSAYHNLVQCREESIYCSFEDGPHCILMMTFRRPYLRWSLSQRGSRHDIVTSTGLPEREQLSCLQRVFPQLFHAKGQSSFKTLPFFITGNQILVVNLGHRDIIAASKGSVYSALVIFDLIMRKNVYCTMIQRSPDQKI